MSRKKCQNQARRLFWLHLMHLMHQPQVTAALIHCLQRCVSCQELLPWRTKTREECSCQPDLLLKTRQKKTQHIKRKEKEKDHHFSLVLSRSPRRATCQAFCLRMWGCFQDVLTASPFPSKVTVGAG